MEHSTLRHNLWISYHYCLLWHSLRAVPEWQQLNCHGPIPALVGTMGYCCLCYHGRESHCQNLLLHLEQTPSALRETPALEKINL